MEKPQRKLCGSKIGRRGASTGSLWVSALKVIMPFSAVE